MVKTIDITTADDVVIGTYDLHFQLYKKWTRNGNFITRSGRRYEMVWVPKWSDNIQHN